MAPPPGLFCASRPMTDANLLTAAILGVVEGVTEFLPVSSTGHLIVTGSLLDYTGEKAKLFEIVIQAGAILAGCWEYRAKLFAVATGIFRDRDAQRFVLNLLIAFLPAAILGLAFGSAIKTKLFAPAPVAAAFIAGAFVILWVERRQYRNPRAARIDRVDDMRWQRTRICSVRKKIALREWLGSRLVRHVGATGGAECDDCGEQHG